VRVVALGREDEDAADIGHLTAVGRREAARVERRGGRAERDDPAGEQADQVAARARPRQVVARDEDRAALVAEPPEDSGERRLGRRIGAGERLVEQEQVGLLDERAREEHALALAGRELADLSAGVALHPNEAPRLAADGRLDEGLAEIERLARAHEKVRAVGETGLDFFRTGPEGREAQVASFTRHIDLAKRLGKTLVIHDRDAHDAVLDVIDGEGAPERWVMRLSGTCQSTKNCPSPSGRPRAPAENSPPALLKGVA